MRKERLELWLYYFAAVRSQYGRSPPTPENIATWTLSPTPSYSKMRIAFFGIKNSVFMPAPIDSSQA